MKIKNNNYKTINIHICHELKGGLKLYASVALRIEFILQNFSELNIDA